MPEFVLLLRDDQYMREEHTPEEHAAHFEKFVRWAEKLAGEGRLRGVERLEAAQGRVVRRREGGGLVLDGPFVEGKEAVLGFFIVEAADWEEASRIAAGCPCVDTGGNVEVRLVGHFPKPRA
jgi:hypothetical protein